MFSSHGFIIVHADCNLSTNTEHTRTQQLEANHEHAQERRCQSCGRPCAKGDVPLTTTGTGERARAGGRHGQCRPWGSRASELMSALGPDSVAAQDPVPPIADVMMSALGPDSVAAQDPVPAIADVSIAASTIESQAKAPSISTVTPCVPDPVETVNTVTSSIGSIPKTIQKRRLVGQLHGAKVISSTGKGSPIRTWTMVGKSPDGTRSVVLLLVTNLYAAGGAVVKTWEHIVMQWDEARRAHVCEVSS